MKQVNLLTGKMGVVQMKNDNLRTTIASKYSSYALVIIGLAISICLLILSPSQVKSYVISFFILITSLFLALFLRIFGNINQMLFDFKGLMSNELGDLNRNIITFSYQAENQNQELINQIKSFHQSLEARIENLSKESDRSVLEVLENLKNSLDHSVLEALENLKNSLDRSVL